MASRFLPRAFFILMIVLPGTAFCADSGQSSLAKKLLNTASQVVVAGVEFGLDWAGEKALGTRGWSALKRITRPIVDHLQEQFPALKFGRPDDPQAAAAAEQAVRYLHQDSALQQLLVDGFMNLEHGQHEILASIDKLETLMRANQQELIILLTQLSQQIDQVAGGLPTRIDVSEGVDRAYYVLFVRAKREGREFNQSVVVLIAASVGAGLFAQRVLEEGRSFNRYETEFFKANWFATPSARFTDDGGHACRKLSVDSPVFGEADKRSSTYSIYCQREGFWRPVQELEQRVYTVQ